LQGNQQRKCSGNAAEIQGNCRTARFPINKVRGSGRLRGGRDAELAGQWRATVGEPHGPGRDWCDPQGMNAVTIADAVRQLVQLSAIPSFDGIFGFGKTKWPSPGVVPLAGVPKSVRNAASRTRGLPRRAANSLRLRVMWRAIWSAISRTLRSALIRSASRRQLTQSLRQIGLGAFGSRRPAPLPLT
jgi:hypothetical protein